MEGVYRNILLPVDGSEESINAFKKGVRQAQTWGSNLYLVQVIPEDDNNTDIGKRNDFLNSLENYANKRDVYLHKELVRGDPRTQIADTLVERFDIDLITMGATGKGQIAKLVIGSITNYVLRNANADIIVSR